MIEEQSLIQQKDQQIMKLQADLRMRNSQIVNLKFCLKLRDDQLMQMRLALAECQSKKSVFLTKLQLKVRELKTATSNCKKLNQRISKAKVASGLEIAHLKSLVNPKDNQVDSLSSVKVKSVRKSGEKEKMKSELKPPHSIFAPQKMKDRKEVVYERCLPETGAEYEMLLIRMEEGNLEPTGEYQINDNQQPPMSDESPKKLPKELLKPLTSENSLKSYTHTDKTPVIPEEYPKAVILPAKDISVSEKNNKERETQSKPLTMEDLGVFGGEQAQSSYEGSLTMEQLGLFGGGGDEIESKKNEEEDIENMKEDSIDLLLRMEEGLLLSSQF